VSGSDGRPGHPLLASKQHRAGARADSNHAAGELWNRAGFALVIADARGTGASFGSRAMELGPREIADYGELIDWAAAQPWSNGRVGLFGDPTKARPPSFTAALGNPHVTAVAACSARSTPTGSFLSGGCATGRRFARWMCDTRSRTASPARSKRRKLTRRPAGRSRRRCQSSRRTG